VSNIKEKIFYLQIDGVSKSLYRKFLNRLKNLSTLIRIKKAKFSEKYFIPASSTPFQFHLFYRNKKDILGYRWFDKSRDCVVSSSVGGSLKYLELKFSQHSKPMFYYGCVFNSIISGGSENSVSLTVTNDLKDLHAIKKATAKTLKYVLFDPLNFLIFLKIMILDFLNFSSGIFDKEKRARIKAKFSDILTKTFFKNIIYCYTRKSIEECMKKEITPIYWNFDWLDIYFHIFGMDEISFRELKIVENDICRIILLSIKRGYRVKIFSDHGQTVSIFLKKQTGKDLKQIFSEILNIDKKHISEIPDKKGFDKIEKTAELIIANNGPVSLIYFRNYNKRLSFEEINNKYPGLIKKLTKIKGIGLVMLKEEKKIKYFGRGKNPLRKYNLTKNQINEIENWAKSEYQGDIILVGDYDGEKIVCFEDQCACHGGFGGEQNERFEININ
jgi:hypothetical protein